MPKTETPRPTIANVARKANVSIATVSRVLNGNAPVEAATATRVRAAIEELSYVPHAAARTLASRKTRSIGLLLPEISGAFFQPLLRGIEAGSSESGYDLLIHSTQMPLSTDIPRRPLGEHNTDGLLIFTDSVDLRELNRLNRIDFPVVLLYQTPPRSLHMPYVTVENQAGACKVVEHLIKTHHRRRIVFLQGPDGNEDSTQREKGYLEALRDHGLRFDPSLVARGRFDREVACDAISQLLLDGVKFDAVFSGDDDAAVGVYLALRRAGIRIPQDISVVGFDDQILASTLTPSLTTACAPTEQVGREAVRILAGLIHGKKMERSKILPTELVIRESCGCQG